LDGGVLAGVCNPVKSRSADGGSAAGFGSERERAQHSCASLLLLPLYKSRDEVRDPVASMTIRPPGAHASDDSLVVDFDAEGRLVGIEFLTPEKRLLPSVLASTDTP
jgi:hypothetical protein